MTDRNIGRKLGMSQVFDTEGKVIPVTVIEAGPWHRDTAEDRADRRVRCRADRIPADEGRQGRQAHAGCLPPEGGQGRLQRPPGDPDRSCRAAGTSAPRSKVDIFKEGDVVDVMGTARGGDFRASSSGGTSRAGARRNGSMFHRAPGSIGASAYPRGSSRT